jgi:hypothetical protein
LRVSADGEAPTDDLKLPEDCGDHDARRALATMPSRQDEDCGAPGASA